MLSFRGRGWRTAKANLQATSGGSERATENRLQQEDVLCVQRAGEAVDQAAECESTADQHVEEDQEVLHR